MFRLARARRNIGSSSLAVSIIGSFSSIGKVASIAIIVIIVSYSSSVAPTRFFTTDQSYHQMRGASEGAEKNDASQPNTRSIL
jgi:hypothetical protein